jgi:predicted metal-dependent phosphoesterase TrpH/energy-coupling factor transporter ATP-binding protein EcfA2
MQATANASTDRRGSLWHRWDLHFHTPASFEYGDKSVTNEQIVDRLVSEGVRVVAITDHHTIDVPRIRRLQELAGDKLTVLPGIELRSELGSKPIHYICIFPEDCNIEDVWTRFQGTLKLTATDIQAKGGDERVYVPIKDGAELARELGGVVSIHAGDKSNSIDDISNREQFQQRIKFDVANQYVDLMEIGQIKDIESHWNIIFPATGLEKPLVICSDNHNIKDYRVKVPLWFHADPTFRGLLMVLRETRDRVFIGSRPPVLARVEQNATKYIRGVSFARRTGLPAGEQWFTGDVEFNDGLVAIIGNKGSGKSALSDTLGLLGSTKNAGFFSFLSTKRFRHPTGGRANFFEATITWESGEAVTRSLAEPVKAEDVERLKYLPQDHVERVCNELVGLGEEGFERELKAVIFSHVPDPQRLNHATFDDLVRFQTGEKQNRIDSLIKQLREVSRGRAVLEAQTDPIVRRELSERIGQRKVEREAHDKAKPTEVPNPAGSSPAPDATLLQTLAAADAKKKELSATITTASEELSRSERRQAVASRLLEKINNFEKEFEVFGQSLEAEAGELGLTPAELATLTLDKARPTAIRDDEATAIAGAKLRLDGKDAQTPGLRAQLGEVEKEIIELQASLDAPNRAYQAYLAALADWQRRREVIEGDAQSPDSLKGLEAALAALDSLPARVAEVREQQAKLAVQIHAEKRAQAEVYRALYGPVQAFIDTHPLAKDKLKLEFRVELTTEDFSGKLLSLLALNRRGSFMGVDEGRARAEALVQATKWEEEASVRAFLEQVDNALHIDQREGQGSEVQLKDQLMKGRKPEDVFDLVYGLDYVRPRYILRWEGKDLSMLSPGERGTLLLVFYLLIDKGDMPLIIDQPEGNLDNHTVAKVLVDCIKAARQRRQVFIVTHNPNLAVVCDADQVVHASMDKANGNLVAYTSGALENPLMSQYITDVLEGTRWAFGVRDGKYKVGET